VTESRKATIPLAHGAESLNVAAAAAIALYELVRRDVAAKSGRG
jgi:tRNA G18 (ribose-2'-O)-methylase SpoU